jgi:hypothetical protein
MHSGSYIARNKEGETVYVMVIEETATAYWLILVEGADEELKAPQIQYLPELELHQSENIFSSIEDCCLENIQPIYIVHMEHFLSCSAHL